MTTIAGHTFDHQGQCITPLTDGSPCPRRWSDIRNADEHDDGALGFSHHGPLTTAHRLEIESKRALEDAGIRDATGFGKPISAF